MSYLDGKCNDFNGSMLLFFLIIQMHVIMENILSMKCIHLTY